MATTRRCPACGAEVQDDAAFCTNCGQRLDAVPSPAPAPIPYQAQPAAQTSSQRSRTSVLPIAIAVAACVAIVAIVVVVTYQTPHAKGTGASSTSSTTTTTTSGNSDRTVNSNTSSSSGSSSSSRSTGSTTSGSDATDSATRSQLQGHVQMLNSLDDRIRDVASDFNKYVKDGSGSSQRSAAQTAFTVQDQVSSSASNLDAISVPSSSPYYDDYQSMQVCYDDLQNRIDCIAESWSLRLDGASDYLAPIRAQNDSNGVNVYKTDFERRMGNLSL